MYTYRRAVGIYASGPRGQQLLDISNMKLSVITQYFRQMLVIVYDEIGQQEVVIDLSDYWQEAQRFADFIQPWLDTKKTVPLITSNKVPGKEYRYVTCEDIQYKWFTPLPGDARLAEDKQSLLTTTGAPDIRLHRTDNANVDYTALAQRCLWTMNGHLVRAVAGPSDVYLLNAGKHFNVDDTCHITCLNFNTVSTLRTLPITEAQIAYENHDTYRFCHLRTDVSLKDKTVWMSIGGRLYLDDIVRVTGDKTIALQVDKVDWFSRIFDSKSMIDLSRVISKDREVVAKDYFYQDATMKALLTDPSTFIIVLDNPHLSVDVTPIALYSYPFTYHTEETKKLPLLLSNGLLPKYYTRKIINRRLLDIDVGLQRRYLNKTAGIHRPDDVLHGFTSRYSPSELFRGYLLKVRSIIQEDS